MTDQLIKDDGSYSFLGNSIFCNLQRDLDDTYTLLLRNAYDPDQILQLLEDAAMDWIELKRASLRVKSNEPPSRKFRPTD